MPQKNSYVIQIAWEFSEIKNRTNAENNNLNVENLVIKNVFVSQTLDGRRRAYRAPSSINVYYSSNCKVEILWEELKVRVEIE